MRCFRFLYLQSEVYYDMMTKFFLFLSLLLTIGAQDYEYGEKVSAEIEIANLELQDDCENLANTLKSSLIANSFNERIKKRESHGELLKRISKNLRPLEENVPGELLRNWTFLTKPGDALLTEKDWSTLVDFDVGSDEFMHTATVHCKNDSQACIFVKNGYHNLLQSSRDETLLKKAWLAWQTLLSSSSKEHSFEDVLNLVKTAASLNGKEDVGSYWGMLLEYDDAYKVADELWDQIKPLYFKLQNYVKKRLFYFYNITETEEIPAYLLGSNFGHDWSAIAGILLPHPLLYNKADTYLSKTTIEEVYKEAEDLTQRLSLGSLGPKFWKNSLFNMSFCENHVISFCAQEHTELLTCDKTSWVSYLDAFEVAIDVTLRNIDYLSLARTSLRYSVIDEAIRGLGSVLAIKDLLYKGVWSQDLLSVKENEMTELLLVALRVLPKLPFYLSADKSRLHVLEKGKKIEQVWWKYRNEYQGVGGVFNNETDFLGDSFMTYNKPYLSKFLGGILQFQFLQYYKNSDWEKSIVENIANDENFMTMLHERSSSEWPTLIVNYYGFYELSASALLDYFAPLETYLESAPLEQVTTTTPEPTTTIVIKEDIIKPKTLIEVKAVNKIEEETEPPLPPKHQHVEENLEGPNPTMEKLTMYIGLALLGGVAAVVISVICTKKVKRRRANNRRYEA